MKRDPLDPNDPAVEQLRRKLEQMLERDIGRYAYHEAAHAVFAHFFRIGVHHVSIGAIVNLEHDTTGDALGRTEYHHRAKRFRLHDHKQGNRAEQMILTAMAGPMAEARYRGRRVAWHRLCGTDRATLDSSLVMTHAGGSSPECQAAYLAYLKTRAAEWLGTLWPRIEVLANVLIDRRKLTGKEVDELVRNVAPTFPRSVSDASKENPETPHRGPFS